MTTQLGLAALTVLDASPLELVGLAEQHGFDSIGVRLLPATPRGTAYPLHTQEASLRSLLRRLDDSPVRVLDVEVLALDADFKAAAFEPVLSAAARLGAVALCVRGDDPDRTRLADSYAELVTLCGTYGLAACLEFVPWTAVTTVRDAVDIVKQADGLARGVVVDALHAARSAASPADIAAIPSDWLHYAQICDGSEPMPADRAELIRQARHERLVPGTGGIALADIWGVLPTDMPVSVEVPNEPLRRAVGTHHWLAHLAESTRKVLSHVAQFKPERRHYPGSDSAPAALTETIP
jgi:sugar phosphate isomerase/epimerase